MFARARKVLDAVELGFEGRTIVAERGEPIAVALLAAGETAIARSPKLHRPRGPACLRGDCDGCLARVDGVPNVMTCLVPCEGGEQVDVQNVLGSRKTDLLRVTDWFFPKGIDHHHLMAGVPALADVMQTFARQMAGIGRLPSAIPEASTAETREVDVLVVGGGPAGLAVAASLLRRGVDVHIVDESSAPGARLVSPEVAASIDDATRALGDRVHRATAAGVYDGRVLSVGRRSATIWRARALVFASGAHDGVLACEGNDLPGVMSARAVAMLAARGIEPTGDVVVVGDGVWGTVLDRLLGARIVKRVADGGVTRVTGRTAVRSVVLKSGASVATSIVAVALPRAPAFELAEQAGCSVRATDAGFAVVVDRNGVAGAGLWAVGECTGAPLDVDAISAAAERAAASIAEALGAQPSSTVSNSAKPPRTKTAPKRPSKTK